MIHTVQRHDNQKVHVCSHCRFAACPLFIHTYDRIISSIFGFFAWLITGLREYGKCPSDNIKIVHRKEFSLYILRVYDRFWSRVKEKGDARNCWRLFSVPKEKKEGDFVSDRGNTTTVLTGFTILDNEVCRIDVCHRQLHVLVGWVQQRQQRPWQRWRERQSWNAFWSVVVCLSKKEKERGKTWVNKNLLESNGSRMIIRTVSSFEKYKRFPRLSGRGQTFESCCGREKSLIKVESQTAFISLFAASKNWLQPGMRII